jgi:NAD(P)H dehydrogenase (quinone)
MKIKLMRNLIITLFVIIYIPGICFGQNVLITYYSESGHTALMAKAVADGVQKVPSVEFRLLTIEETSNDDLRWADAIIVGSPVHSGNIAAAVQEFIRSWPFQEGDLKDKIGAVFVTGGGISAGEELAQMNLIHTLMVFNMIIVGGPTWDQPFGASAVTGEEPFTSDSEEVEINERFLQKGIALGERVTKIARRFSTKN